MKRENNIDAAEVSKFEELAHRWWDPQGAFKPLHDINPLRARYIDERAGLAEKRILDVGCGGGILSEEMAKRGAKVTAIDAGEQVIKVARLHQEESGTVVDYQQLTAEEHLAELGESYDVVTCLELLEHVPDPQALVQTCAQLARPGGDVFFSTINRNPQAWLLAIVAAEYVLGLVPRGTHDYQKLVKPSELARWGRAASLELRDLSGMAYNPLTGAARLRQNVDVNYLTWMQRR